MKETLLWIESDDGAKLWTRFWRPDSAPRAVVNLVHGMAEHGDRYARLAEKFAAKGIELWAADQRGHGKTANLQANDAGRGGLLGHCCDGDGFARAVKDIGALNSFIVKNRSEKEAVPLFVMGHSWGSFLVQSFMEGVGASAKKAVPPIAGFILSGTAGPGNPLLSVGAPLCKIIAALKGQRKVSKLAHNLAFGPYNKPFRPNRTDFDWLSRDAAEVDAYVADSLCGFYCSSGFFRDLTANLVAIHKPEAIAAVPKDSSVYVFCGNADPVGMMGQGPTRLVACYRENGIADLELSLYPDARHETLNETNRDEVAEDLINWILRHS